MMAKVKILIEGYAREIKDGWLASSTTTLIEESGKRIIVDPGINRKLLLQKIKVEGLRSEDIDIVFMTHYHPDHVFLAAIFKNALIVDGDIVYEKDKETEYKGRIPGTKVKVLATPGHAHEHTSLVVETDKGVVVVAADVFWWMDSEEQKVDDVKALLDKEDPFTKDKDALLKSRKQVLQIADWIIPGHGKMFRVPIGRKT